MRKTYSVRRVGDLQSTVKSRPHAGLREGSSLREELEDSSGVAHSCIVVILH